MAENIRTLGDAGSNLLTELTRRNKRVFTYEDAAQATGIRSSALRDLLSNLVKRRWLQRIEKGKYLILPFEAGREGEWTEHEFIIGSFLIDPYYIGFRSALNHYGYTEQISRTVYLASPRRKLRATLDVSGVTYRFVNLPERKFFGASEVALDGHRVNVSDREKTIVDCLDGLEYCGGVVEVVKALWYGRDELDLAKLANYASRNGNRAAIQRLGYLLETLGYGTEQTLASLRRGISGSYAPLDTLSPRKGRYVDRWKVLVNIREADLDEWRPG